VLRKLRHQKLSPHPCMYIHTYIHTCRGIASVEIFKGYDAVSSNDVLSNNVLYNDVLSNDVLS
jgi:hypothetical protein